MKQLLPAVCAFAIAAVAVLEAAKIKVKAAPDPGFDFGLVSTFAWDDEPGRVIMARTPMDDPESLRAFVDPRIRKYVEQEMIKRGKTLVTSGAPDIQLHYYVLVTINSQSQFMGQFLPSVPYWGLPPFDAGTTALEVATKGSLVLDAMLPGKPDARLVIWRGIAQSTVEDTDKPEVRDKRLREAAAELVKRFPLKKVNR
jgi:hypothetical protein